MYCTRFLLPVAAVVVASVMTVAHAQDIGEPEPYLIDKFLPKSTALKTGYFITEDQLKKLSPEARAELEKLLREKLNRTARIEVQQRRVQEEYQKAQDALKKAVAEQQRYRYMIGVTVEPNKGNDDGGVIVSRVVEDSPAERAGVAPGEVILSVKGTRKVSSPEDLIEAVEASEGKEIVLRLKTYGEKGSDRSIVITPVERPGKYKTGESQTEASDAETHRIWFQALEQYKDNNVKFRAIHPGIYWDQAALQQDLPENVSITISKSGKEPTTIIVKRDGESWNMNQTEVDQLPEDLRGPIKRLLSRPDLKIWSVGPKDGVASGIPATVIFEKAQAKTPDEQKLLETHEIEQNQLQQIQQQLETLQKAVEKLQQEQKPE